MTLEFKGALAVAEVAEVYRVDIKTHNKYILSDDAENNTVVATVQ